MEFLKVILMLALILNCAGVGFLMFALGYDFFKDWKNK